MPDQLQHSLEDNVLTVLVWHEVHASTVALRVPADLFSTRAYQRIAEVAHEYLEKYGQPPRVHLRDLLEADLRRGAEGQFLGQIIGSMEQLQGEIQVDYVIRELDRFIGLRNLSLAVERASDSLHAGDLEAAQESLAGTGISSATMAHPRSWFHDVDSWLAFLNEDDQSSFSSGVAELDARNVVPRRKTLFLIIGSTGSGKSWWLHEIGKMNMLMHRRNVLHITLENDLEEAQLRYTMSFLARTQGEAKSISIPVMERDGLGRFIKLGHAQQEFAGVNLEQRRQIRQDLTPFHRRGRLLVQWFPSGSLTVAQLSSYLDMLSRTENFRPDLILLDYLDMMHVDSRDHRLGLGQLTKDLRGLAGQRNLALVTATQGNRYSATARTVGTNMVSEDWSKIGTSDIVCTYSQTLDEKNVNLARLLVGKARRARDKWSALITQSYDTGQFCLDSCYFNKLAESEVMRLTAGDVEAEVQG